MGKNNTCLWEIRGDVLYITTRKGETILADAEDYERLHHYSWCIAHTGYPVCNSHNVVIKMHRYLLGAPPQGKVVDHINRNKLDNRKSNLRFCTQKENSRNTSKTYSNRTGFLGVDITPHGKYRARIFVDGREIRLGHFETIEQARRARVEAEKQYFGAYAPGS